MPTDQLDLTFAALADPTRRAILARLAEGEATVNELAEPFSVSLPAISRHLKVLERAHRAVGRRPLGADDGAARLRRGVPRALRDRRARRSGATCAALRPDA